MHYFTALPTIREAENMPSTHALKVPLGDAVLANELHGCVSPIIMVAMLGY